jgi:2-polyprenyl-3-methyl-5-hydroxy-6-metoxy-1,4-benzoquinol methylase
MLDFSRRATSLEVMDDLDVAGPDLTQALRELDSINYLLGGNYVSLNGLGQLLDARDSRGELHIADLGCGSGDLLKRVRQLLDRKGIKARLTGFDANPNVIRFARDHTPATSRIEFEALNIFSDDFQRRVFDVAMGTLFFHHFTENELVTFFNKLKDQVNVGLVINDIHRHWFAYYSIKWLTSLFSRSPMVKHDGPLSVMRAFRRKELMSILREAGFTRFRVKWCWAFRWQVIVWA